MILDDNAKNSALYVDMRPMQRQMEVEKSRRRRSSQSLDRSSISVLWLRRYLDMLGLDAISATFNAETYCAKR